MKRITSKRPSNAHIQGQLIRPNGSAVVSDEVVERLILDGTLLEGEWDIEDVADAAPPDTPPEVQTRPAKKGRTRK